MGAMRYVFICTTRNFLKNLIKKPLTLVMYLLLVGVLVGNSVIVLMGQKSNKSVHFGLEFYLMAALILILISVIPALYQSISKCALSLKMADVNFLMTGPFKPARILLYAQIKTAMMSILVSVFMVVQIPVIIGFFGMKTSDIPVFLFAWFLMLVSATPINLAVFVLIFKYPALKTIAKIIFALYCVALTIFVGATIATPEGPMAGLKNLVWNQGLNYFPLVGWYFEVFKAAVTGINSAFFLNVGLILGTTAGSFAIVFKLVDTDFYEDAIKTSELMETVKKAAKEGRSYMGTAFGLKERKVKTVQYKFTRSGAAAILQKNLLELKKTGVYFLNLKSILIILLDCLISYFVPVEDEIGLSIKILAVLGANMYLLLLSSSVSSINRELDKSFIYLIPANNFKKLIALTSIAALKNFADTLIAMVIICVYFKASPGEGILAAFIIAALSYTFNFMDLTAGMLFGRLESAGLKMFFKMMFNIFLMIPSLIIFAVLMEMGKSVTLGFASLLLTTIIGGSFLMIPATFSIKKPELNA